MLAIRLIDTRVGSHNSRYVKRPVAELRAGYIASPEPLEWHGAELPTASSMAVFSNY